MHQKTRVNEVWYLRIWGTFHLVVGFVFSLVFIVGALFLKDYSLFLYLLFSGLLIYMGLIRLRKPYLTYNTNKILMYGMFGEISKTYTWNTANDLVVKDKRIFLTGKKLPFNAWFTNRHQYERMLEFFSGEKALEDELQE